MHMKTSLAVKLLEEALQHSNPNADIFEHLGDAYAKMQNKGKAILYWRKALDFAPQKQAVAQKIKDAEKKE